jgi:hypothetical protein
MPALIAINGLVVSLKRGIIESLGPGSCAEAGIETLEERRLYFIAISCIAAGGGDGRHQGL